LEPKCNLNLPGTKVCLLLGDTFSGIGAIFGQECQKRSMLVRVAGDAIMMLPTLIMTPREVGEVDELMRIYGEALKATEVRVAELKSKRN